MIKHKLITWYLETNRDLPWRINKNPYEVWLSEIILQQTQVAQGLPYFLRFIEKFPTVRQLAKADESTVLKLWQGLGYYSRARNLHLTAKHITNNLNGVFPDNYNDLIKLKGVGDYTASAIASICFDEVTAVVDGNVYRVLARYFGIATPINSTKGKKEFKELAQTLIDEKHPGTYNQAIMDFGALQCKPQNPLCGECPLSDSCVALEKKTIKTLPVKTKKAPVKKRYLNYLVVKTSSDKTVLTKRNGKGIWQGLYQFPLIETEKPINQNQLTISQEFKTLFKDNVSATLFNSQTIIHKLSHQHLYTKFWIVETPRIENYQTITWNAVETYPVPALIEKFLKQYLNPKN